MKGTPRSKYACDLIGEVLCLLDLDEPGTRSVTNDAEQVVPELHARGMLPPGRRLIYRDSDGVWDELLIADGQFAGFRPLRARTIAGALSLVQKAEP